MQINTNKNSRGEWLMQKQKIFSEFHIIVHFSQVGFGRLLPNVQLSGHSNALLSNALFYLLKEVGMKSLWFRFHSSIQPFYTSRCAEFGCVEWLSTFLLRKLVDINCGECSGFTRMDHLISAYWLSSERGNSWVDRDSVYF